MYFNPALGMQGNIEKSLQNTANEVENRALADRENREAVEQALTDQYLDGVQAQQDITDLMLEVAELKGE